MKPITQEFVRLLGADIADAGVWLFNWYMAVLPFLKAVSFAVCALLIGGIFYAVTNSGYLDFRGDLRRDFWGGKGIVAKKMRRKWRAPPLSS